MMKHEGRHSFEEAMDALENSLNCLEKKELSLSDMVACYREGMDAASECFAFLEKAEEEVRIISAHLSGDKEDEDC